MIGLDSGNSVVSLRLDDDDDDDERYIHILVYIYHNECVHRSPIAINGTPVDINFNTVRF